MRVKISLFLASVLFTLPAFSQGEAKTGVILYNVVPVSAEILPDGTIVSIDKKVENYLEGYTIVNVKKSLNPNATADEAYTSPGEGYTVSKQVYNLMFGKDLAKLSKAILTALDEAASTIATDPTKKVMLTAYNPSSAEEAILLKNRLNACLLYLEIKGLTKSQIAINDIPQETNDNLIIATILIQ